MNKEWEPNPWSAAIWEAENTGDLKPLLALLRSSELLSETARAELAASLEHWLPRRWRDTQAEDSALEDAKAEFYEITANLAPKQRAEFRSRLVEFVAGYDAKEAARLDEFLQNRGRPAGRARERRRRRFPPD